MIKIVNSTQKAVRRNSGYTLVELVVAVGLFALIMTLISGAYLMMINLDRQAQGTAVGIDNLSFALETMTRTIRSGINYNNNIDCPPPDGCSSFSVKNITGPAITYALSNSSITQNGVAMTDPSVSVSSLIFYASGTKNAANSPNDNAQPYVTIVVSGKVSAGVGKPSQSFTVETGAAMRTLDL